MEEILALGSMILKIIIRSKIKDEIIGDSLIDISDYVKKLGIKKFEAREVTRKFEKISDDVSRSCMEILDKTSFEKERKVLICSTILEALEKANINTDTLRECQRDEDKLTKIIQAVSGDIDDEFNAQEKEIYIRLLSHVSHILINVFMQYPVMSVERSQYLIKGMDSLEDKMEDILTRLQQIEEKTADSPSTYDKFEKAYKKNIITRYSYIYLFGADEIKQELKRYKLTSAYVQLEVDLIGKNERISLENIFAEKRKNIWISGEAGSGKTTFLSWLAINIASPEDIKISSLRDTVPIVIELRKYPIDKLSIINCINSVMSDSSIKIPEGWVEDALGMGRLLFLVDGFDEIAESDRERVFEWIDALDGKNKCKKIFTSRPQVKSRPAMSEVSEMKLLPMNMQRINEFVEYWHNAVLKERLQHSEEHVEITKKSLLSILEKTEALYKLASNPLLCAMICALHYRNGMYVPTSKRDLYEACCKLLLENRDIERDIKGININLTYEKKKIILSKLACNMMRNNSVESPKKDVLLFLDATISDMGLEVCDEKLLQYLLERSGIIREPEHEKIGFIHRSFQEYLCAFELSRQMEWKYLESKIAIDEWLETICLAIGFAPKEKANDIIHKTLKIGEDCGEDKKYLFYALEYLAGSLEIDEKLREVIKKKMELYIPPQSPDCEQIAKAGNVAVQYLKNSEHYSVEERCNCIYTLDLIGTREALQVVKTYVIGELTEREIVLIGDMFNRYRKGILIEECIPDLVVDYLKENKKQHMVLSDGFLRVLILADTVKVKELEKVEITKISIVDYYGRIVAFPKVLANKVCELEMKGNFVHLPILATFKTLDKLKINAQNEFFDLYSLNVYKNIYKVSKVELILHRKGDIFINGKDMNFLQNCRELALVFLGDQVELEFDYFHLFKKLKKLTVGAEYASEFYYEELDFLQEINVLSPFYEKNRMLIPHENLKTHIYGSPFLSSDYS